MEEIFVARVTIRGRPHNGRDCSRIALNAKLTKSASSRLQIVNKFKEIYQCFLDRYARCNTLLHTVAQPQYPRKVCARRCVPSPLTPATTLPAMMIRLTLALPLLLIVPLAPALGNELRIDPTRLQAQVQQRTEQAAVQGAAPTEAAEWITAPAAAPSMGYGHGGQSDQNRSYGQGYERRYGQNGDLVGSASTMSPAGISQGTGGGQGSGMSGGGGGHGRH